MIKHMQDSDWSLQFEALNLCRSLLKFSSELLKSLNFHEIIFQVLLFADSLRSSLSKNSLMTVCDICQYFPRSLDADMDAVTSLLLRKSVDTNVFISESAVTALNALCQCCTEGKVVGSLLNNLTTARSSLVKAKTAGCFEVIFRKLDLKVGKLRELERILKKLAEFSTEASPEVRSSSKSALKTLSNSLLNTGELDRILFRCLSTEEYKQVKAFMTTTQTNVTIRPSRFSRFHRQNTGMEGSKRGTSLPPPLPSDLTEQLNSIQTDIADSNWQKRSMAVAQAAEMLLNSRDIRGKVVTAVDVLGKGLSDRNVNVVFRALDVVKTLVSGEGKEALTGHVLVLVEGVVGALGSGNAGIRATSRDVFSLLVKQWEPGTLIQPLIGCLSSATDKAKVTIYQSFIDLAPRLYQKRPSLIHKHLIPALKVICSERKPEMRQLGLRLAKSLYDLLGSELLESMNTDQLPRLLEALSSL